MDPEKQKSLKAKSALQKANETDRITGYSWIGYFGSGLAGSVFLSTLLLMVTSLSRIAPGDYSGILAQSLIGGVAVFAIYACTSPMTIMYNFADSIAAMIIIMFPKKYWTNTHVGPKFFRRYERDADRFMWSFAIPSGKMLTEWVYQFLGALLGSLLVLGVLPGASTIVHNLGQPAILAGATTGDAILAEILGGTIFKWVTVLAFGASDSRFKGHAARSAVAAGGYVVARAITGYTIQSSFNFWLYLVPGIWVGVHPDWWVFFVGDLASTAAALIFYYVLHRERREVGGKSRQTMD